jgi:ribokinase
VRTGLDQPVDVVMAVSESDSAEVVVLGSANVDLVFAVPAIPSPGETVLATGQARHAGGKGLNQAVAAARAGARTAFICALGDDAEGRELAGIISDVGIDSTLIRTVDAPTGTALITVQDGGENAIVVAAGANGVLTHLDDAQRRAISAAGVLVAQQEVPAEVLLEGAQAARAAGTVVVLNAAPARPVDDALLEAVDVLVVNEHEAMSLSGEVDPHRAGRRLVEQVRTVVVTVGDQGCIVIQGDSDPVRVPAIAAEVVDTTGAGDTFTGVLAAGLAEGQSALSATRLAVVAAALSVERPGAVPSIPSRAEIEDRARARA